MGDNGQPALVPPLGARRPMGGESRGESQYAPVAPAGPMPMGLGAAAGAGMPPTWLQPPQQAVPQPSLDERLNADLQRMVVDGLQYGAPVAQIMQHFPIVTLEDLHELGRRHGVPVNLGTTRIEPPPPQVQQVPTPQPVQESSPIAQAMAPQAQVSASLGLEPEAGVAAPPVLLDIEKAPAMRVSQKKHWPLIEKAMRQGAYTPEQISVAIGIPTDGTRKAMLEIVKKLEAERTGAPAPQQTVEAEPAEEVEAGGPDAVAIAALRRVLVFSQSTGLSYLEIAAAAELLYQTSK